MKKIGALLTVGLLILALTGFAAAGVTAREEAKSAICEVLSNIAWLLYMIAGGVAIVIIVLQGVKWTGSAEDPGARKQAKQGIIHAVVGLVIVILAVWIVGMVFSNNECFTSLP